MVHLFDWFRAKGAEPAGLFGKIPNQPDFVRIRAAADVVEVFDGWLQASYGQFDKHSVALTDEPTYFLFSSPNARQSILGVLKASRDEVGRQFPVAVFGYLEASAAAKNLACLPLCQREFLSGLDDVLAMTTRMSAGELRSLLDNLAPVESAGYKPARSSLDDWLHRTPAVERLGRLFGREPGRIAFALYSIMKAVEPVVGGRPSGPGPTLDCPIQDRQDVVMWSLVAEKTCRWKKAPPALLWREGPNPRLLMTFGLMPPAGLPRLESQKVEDDRIWPLTTDLEDAERAALSSLGPAFESALDRESTTLAELFDHLGSGKRP